MTTEAERQKAYRDRIRGGPPRDPTWIHGTVAGARRHQRRQQPLCEPCREAWAEYYRNRKATT